MDKVVIHALSNCRRKKFLYFLLISSTIPFACDAKRNVMFNWETNHTVLSLSLLDFISVLENLFLLMLSYFAACIACFLLCILWNLFLYESTNFNIISL